MNLTPAMERYILHWGEMGSRWGVNRSVAQVHALLYLADRPLSADEIVETLGIARSNVSTSLKELQSWDLISMTHAMGERRDFFEAKSDLWDILLTVVDGRKKREIDPTLSMMRRAVLDARDEKNMPSVARERMEDMLDFVEAMNDWYGQVSRLPKPVLIKLMKMGAKVGKLVKKK
ncbi:MAG: MarR family transcriptional regulator [Pseudomonadota bacterium]